MPTFDEQYPIVLPDGRAVTAAAEHGDELVYMRPLPLGDALRCADCGQITESWLLPDGTARCVRPALCAELQARRP